jgi:hypothetical protein
LGSIDEAAALIGSGDSSDLTLDFRFDWFFEVPKTSYNYWLFIS